ncbi:unnamed protein product [Protopolystoma xenopodis]|uniref:Uncharacterized protein n=1 Tax=Protopolystoma xenopodis TaxID=117903 RepID=A0A448WK87_9PLAT|nr:unnamed protein product [Protopolystoma xenopodis]
MLEPVDEPEYGHSNRIVHLAYTNHYAVAQFRKAEIKFNAFLLEALARGSGPAEPLQEGKLSVELDSDAIYLPQTLLEVKRMRSETDDYNFEVFGDLVGKDVSGGKLFLNGDPFRIKFTMAGKSQQTAFELEIQDLEKFTITATMDSMHSLYGSGTVIVTNCAVRTCMITADLELQGGSEVVTILLDNKLNLNSPGEPHSITFVGSGNMKTGGTISHKYSANFEQKQDVTEDARVSDLDIAYSANSEEATLKMRLIKGDSRAKLSTNYSRGDMKLTTSQEFVCKTGQYLIASSLDLQSYLHFFKLLIHSVKISLDSKAFHGGISFFRIFSFMSHYDRQTKVSTVSWNRIVEEEVKSNYTLESNIGKVLAYSLGRDDSLFPPGFRYYLSAGTNKFELSRENAPMSQKYKYLILWDKESSTSTLRLAGHLIMPENGDESEPIGFQLETNMCADEKPGLMQLNFSSLSGWRQSGHLIAEVTGDCVKNLLKQTRDEPYLGSSDRAYRTKLYGELTYNMPGVGGAELDFLGIMNERKLISRALYRSIQSGVKVQHDILLQEEDSGKVRWSTNASCVFNRLLKLSEPCEILYMADGNSREGRFGLSSPGPREFEVEASWNRKKGETFKYEHIVKDEGDLQIKLTTPFRAMQVDVKPLRKEIDDHNRTVTFGISMIVNGRNANSNAKRAFTWAMEVFFYSSYKMMEAGLQIETSIVKPVSGPFKSNYTCSTYGLME